MPAIRRLFELSARRRKNEKDRQNAGIITREKYLLIKERRHSFVLHLISISDVFSSLYIPFVEVTRNVRKNCLLTSSCKLLAIPSTFHPRLSVRQILPTSWIRSFEEGYRALYRPLNPLLFSLVKYIPIPIALCYPGFTRINET